MSRTKRSSNPGRDYRLKRVSSSGTTKAVEQHEQRRAERQASLPDKVKRRETPQNMLHAKYSVQSTRVTASTAQTPVYEYMVTWQLPEHMPREPRVAALLARIVPELDPRIIQALVLAGCVRVDGHVYPGSVRNAGGGSTLSVCVPQRGYYAIAPVPMNIDVLYEDQHILVVNKPAGMTQCPTGAASAPSLLHFVLHHVHLQNIARSARDTALSSATQSASTIHVHPHHPKPPLHTDKIAVHATRYSTDVKHVLQGEMAGELDWGGRDSGATGSGDAQHSMAQQGSTPDYVALLQGFFIASDDEEEERAGRSADVSGNEQHEPARHGGTQGAVGGGKNDVAMWQPAIIMRNAELADQLRTWFDSVTPANNAHDGGDDQHGQLPRVSTGMVHVVDTWQTAPVIFSKLKTVGDDLVRQFADASATRHFYSLNKNQPSQDVGTSIFPLHEHHARGRLLGSDLDDVMMTKRATKHASSYAVHKLYRSGDVCVLQWACGAGVPNEVCRASSALDCPVLGDDNYGVTTKKLSDVAYKYAAQLSQKTARARGGGAEGGVGGDGAATLADAHPRDTLRLAILAGLGKLTGPAVVAGAVLFRHPVTGLLMEVGQKLKEVDEKVVGNERRVMGVMALLDEQDSMA